MKNELGTDKVTIDPNTGQRFIYVGAGKSEAYPQAILAYSPSDVNGRTVLFADGSVQVLTPEKFEEAMQRDAALPRVPTVATAPPQTSPAQVVQQPAAPVPAAPAAAPIPSLQPGPQGGVAGSAAAALARPTATGVRPIRIEVPRTGRAFNFTKVLNVGQESLSVSFSSMRLSAWRTVQMLLQVTGFLVGLGMLWWQAAASKRKAYWMAIAALLISCKENS